MMVMPLRWVRASADHVDGVGLQAGQLRHLRRVQEESRRGGERLGVWGVQVVDLQRVQGA